MKLTFFLLVLGASVSSVLSGDPLSRSAGGVVTLLPGEPGAGGGRVTGTTVTAEISVGDTVAGGISQISGGGVQAKTGYTGQLHDGVSMLLSAAPSTTVTEGDSVRLSADVTMDDGTLTVGAPVRWSVLGGPIDSIGADGVATAGTTARNAPATARAVYDTLSGDISLLVVASPFAPYPFSWEDPDGNGPYRIFLGTEAGNLVLVSTVDDPRFNPGQLLMGTEYWWQVLDAEDNDLTPGGGPASFVTDLYQPDTRVGLRAAIGAQRGNNIYNGSGAGQRVSVTMKGKKPGSMHFSIENDGDVADVHRLAATRPSRRLGRVLFLRLNGPRRGNVTAAATRAAYFTEEMNPGAASLYRVTAMRKGTRPVRQSLRFTSISSNDTRGRDAGVGALNVKAIKKR